MRRPDRAAGRSRPGPAATCDRGTGNGPVCTAAGASAARSGTASPATRRWCASTAAPPARPLRNPRPPQPGARRAAEDAGEEKRRRRADRKRAWRAESPARLAQIAESQPLTPQQSAKLRGHIVTAIGLQLPQAHAVVMGIHQWTPTQARVFALLLDKVLPNLSASYGLAETAATGVEQMTREALEAVAAGIGGLGDGAGREAER